MNQAGSENKCSPSKRVSNECILNNYNFDDVSTDQNSKCENCKQRGCSLCGKHSCHVDTVNNTEHVVEVAEVSQQQQQTRSNNSCHHSLLHKAWVYLQSVITTPTSGCPRCNPKPPPSSSIESASQSSIVSFLSSLFSPSPSSQQSCLSCEASCPGGRSPCQRPSCPKASCLNARPFCPRDFSPCPSPTPPCANVKPRSPKDKQTHHNAKPTCPHAKPSCLNAECPNLICPNAEPSCPNAMLPCPYAKPPCPNAKCPNAKQSCPSLQPPCPHAKPTSTKDKPPCTYAKPPTPDDKPTCPHAKPSCLNADCPNAEPSCPNAMLPCPYAKPPCPNAKCPNAKPSCPSLQPPCPHAKPTCPNAKCPNSKSSCPSLQPPCPHAKPTSTKDKPTCPHAKPPCLNAECPNLICPNAEPSCPYAKPPCPNAKCPNAKPSCPSAQPPCPKAKPCKTNLQPPCVKLPCPNSKTSVYHSFSDESLHSVCKEALVEMAKVHLEKMTSDHKIRCPLCSKRPTCANPQETLASYLRSLFNQVWSYFNKSTEQNTICQPQCALSNCSNTSICTRISESTIPTKSRCCCTTIPKPDSCPTCLKPCIKPATCPNIYKCEGTTLPAKRSEEEGTHEHKSCCTPCCMHNSLGVQPSSIMSDKSCWSSQTSVNPSYIRSRQITTPRSVEELKASITGVACLDKSSGNMLGCEVMDFRTTLKYSKPCVQDLKVTKDSICSTDIPPPKLGSSLTKGRKDHKFGSHPMDCKHLKESLDNCEETMSPCNDLVEQTCMEEAPCPSSGGTAKSDEALLDKDLGSKPREQVHSKEKICNSGRNSVTCVDSNHPDRKDCNAPETDGYRKDPYNYRYYY